MATYVGPDARFTCTRDALTPTWAAQQYKNVHAHAWTQILKAYKRGNLHIVNAARTLIQRAKYIMYAVTLPSACARVANSRLYVVCRPGLKRNLAQQEKAVAECTRKSTETRRQLTQLKRKQREEYTKLRIPVRADGAHCWPRKHAHRSVHACVVT